MRIVRKRVAVDVSPRVYRCITGTEMVYRCSQSLDCMEEPLAEVVVNYVKGGEVCTLWCAEHLPNLSALHRSDAVQGVELLSTVRGA